MALITINQPEGYTDVLVPGYFMEHYLPSAAGEHVKVYLLLLQAIQRGSGFDTADIADKLESTEKDIVRSLGYWAKKGLLTLHKQGTTISAISFNSPLCPAPPVAGGVPDVPVKAISAPVSEASAADTAPVTENNEGPVQTKEYYKDSLVLTPELISKAEENEQFKVLSHMMTAYSQKVLSHMDYDLFMHFYYRMNCDFDVCEYILNYCADHKKLSMKNIDKKSIECISLGYTDLASIKLYLSLDELSVLVIKALGLTIKKLPPVMMEYVTRWSLDYRMDSDLIIEACNRGVLKTKGEDAFPYVDSILNNWHKAGISTMEAVLKEDEKHKADNLTKYKGRAGVNNSSATTKAGPNSKNSFNRFDQSERDFDEDEARFLTRHIKDTSEDTQ